MSTIRTMLSVFLVVALIAPGTLVPLTASAQAQPAAPARPAADYEGWAVAASFFSVPGRAIICTVGGVTSVAVMLLTFGTAYGAAKSVLEEGCGGQWVVTAEDLRRANEPGTGRIKEDPWVGWPGWKEPGGGWK